MTGFSEQKGKNAPVQFRVKQTVPTSCLIFNFFFSCYFTKKVLMTDFSFNKTVGVWMDKGI